MLPTLFQIGPFAVHSYGLALALAFVVGTVILYRGLKARGQDAPLLLDSVLTIVVFALVFSLLAARLVYCLIEWPYYLARPLDVLRLNLGGLSFHGGVIGGVLGGWAGAHRARINLWRVLDISAPSVAVGYSIVRIGCFLNGCCYGTPTDAPWGVVFFDVARHPTQLYDSALGLLVFGLTVVAARRPRFNGYAWWFFIGLSSVQRFIVESWRDAMHVAGWLTLGQATSVVLVAASGVIIWVGLRRAARARVAAAGGAAAGGAEAAAAAPPGVMGGAGATGDDRRA